ncbi:Transposase, IS4 [Azotobacter vinelandii CA]|uniref:Transposase, IS4 n=4 Tax=Azotobacter group TaxID=351 RepID=C1DIH4_AZOVD|nr:IS5 family transposase [Azotobacter vinelandii]ACO78655.1 Transposase, IS4 [Azotobacter vinelandii DJ]AGK14948.1 Transposase, IS4 [Azotobacter vinelandii CA]AGK20633.1 Transposase, IS4 [Azotobacter vinelandii CA6]GLK60472.1 IS5 family transposase ISMac22 [Azotobacter vinelandii]
MFSLFADQEREAKLDSLGDPLALLDKHVDFVALAAEIDRRVPRPSRAKGGRPPYPTELMTRLLVLQQLFNLSDEQMEFQLLDRMSFQRFAGVKHTGRVPDRNTIWCFRERLVKANVEHQIFAEVQLQLQAQGFQAREGQIIDASIVRAPTQHNTADEQAVVKERAIPVEWSPAKRRQKDVEARWTKKHGKSYFGYKLSVSVDRRHKLIRCVRVSDASEADTLHLVDVLDRGNSSRDFWADRGYHDKPRERWLKLIGWRPHIQRKGQAGKPIHERSKARNKRLASPRARVEHVFASLTQMGGKVVRSIGLARAEFSLVVKSAVYNLKRMSSLLEMA